MYSPPHARRVNFRVSQGYDAPGADGLDIVLLPRGYEGDGLLAGTVTVDGVPTGNRIVEVWIASEEVLLETVEVDAFGQFSIDDLDSGWGYDLISYDNDRIWEKRVSSQRFPMPMNISLTGDIGTMSVGVPVSDSIEIYGGAPGYTATLVSGTLPDGVALVVVDNMIEFGTPTALGSGTMTIKVTDRELRTAERTISWEVT